MAKATDNFSPHRVVLDTNVHISSILYKGAPRKVIDRLQSPDLLQVTSQSLLTELARILEHKFCKSAAFVATELDTILTKSLLVAPTQTIAICRDPDDNHILECAVSGQANYIVTGDKDLLTLHHFQEIPILTPSQFLDLLQPPLPI